MPRFPQAPDPESIEAAERPAFDAVQRRLAALADDGPGDPAMDAYWGALLNSPEAAEAITQMGRMVRTRGVRDDSYTHAQREIADIVLCQDLGYYGVLGMHIPDALAVGVRLEAIDAILHGSEQELTEEERLLTEYIRQAVSGTVTDVSFAAIEELMGTRGAIDYTVFTLFLNFTLRMWQALDVPSPSMERVDELIEEFRSGERLPPDPAAHIG
jgi:hypothetical protein